jgi:quinol monooxygenase YgiN
VVTITAAQGKGGDLAESFKGRCAEVIKEPGCEQFEARRSLVDPDKVVLLERWADQTVPDIHAKRNQTRPPMPAGLRVGNGDRGDYVYNRTG